ncbi:hypothetical protein ACPXBI_28890, partial [Escherichia coli]|uniref:hypothetical protein n=1 Tax=Escherichia coli TaxID=562 RepID=UPI003CE4A162
EHAERYTTNWYAEQIGQTVPLAAAVFVGHKLFGAAGAKEALGVDKEIAQGSNALQRASSLSLRPTPLGLNVR